MNNELIIKFAIGFIAFFIGFISQKVFLKKKYDCVLHINQSNKEKDIYQFVILCPIEELSEKKDLFVKVQNDK